MNRRDPPVYPVAPTDARILRKIVAAEEGIFLDSLFRHFRRAECCPMAPNIVGVGVQRLRKRGFVCCSPAIGRLTVTETGTAALAKYDELRRQRVGGATRAPGYYWVKEPDPDTGNTSWQIAHWKPLDAFIMPGWWMAGRVGGGWDDDAFVEIDEYRLERL